MGTPESELGPVIELPDPPESVIERERRKRDGTFEVLRKRPAAR